MRHFFEEIFAIIYLVLCAHYGNIAPSRENSFCASVSEIPTERQKDGGMTKTRTNYKDSFVKFPPSQIPLHFVILKGTLL